MAKRKENGTESVDLSNVKPIWLKVPGDPATDRHAL